MMQPVLHSQAPQTECLSAPAGADRRLHAGVAAGAVTQPERRWRRRCPAEERSLQLLQQLPRQRIPGRGQPGRAHETSMRRRPDDATRTHTTACRSALSSPTRGHAQEPSARGPETVASLATAWQRATRQGTLRSKLIVPVSRPNDRARRMRACVPAAGSHRNAFPSPSHGKDGYTMDFYA